MVNATVIFILVLIVLAILAVVIAFIYLQRQRNSQNGPGPPDRAHPSGWSKEEDGPNPSHNFCGVYTFPSTNPSVPAPITLDPEVLNALTPVPVAQTGCVDPDQIAAKQVQQVCHGDGTVSGVCYGSRGETYHTGQSRTFYVECNQSKCKDTLATVALNFQPRNLQTQTGCLQVDHSNPTRPITIERCDLTQPGQLFRIDRQTATGTANPSGPYGRIFDRITGKCVIPASQNPTPGDKLTLGECSPAQGYVWWFFPPQSVTDPTFFFFDENRDQSRIIGRPVTATAPQQLVYYPNPGKQPPGVGDVGEFVLKNNPVSMAAPIIDQSNNNNDNGPPLTNYGQDVTLETMALNPLGQRYNSQTLDYWLYQTITNIPADSATGTNFPWYTPQRAPPAKEATGEFLDETNYRLVDFSQLEENRRQNLHPKDPIGAHQIVTRRIEPATDDRHQVIATGDVSIFRPPNVFIQ